MDEGSAWDCCGMKRLTAFLGCVLVQALAVGQDSQPRDMHQMHRLHQDSKAYITMLDDPKRDAYQKPHEVITALKLKKREVIADIGAGSGYSLFAWPTIWGRLGAFTPWMSART